MQNIENSYSNISFSEMCSLCKRYNIGIVSKMSPSNQHDLFVYVQCCIENMRSHRILTLLQTSILFLWAMLNIYVANTTCGYMNHENAKPLSLSEYIQNLQSRSSSRLLTEISLKPDIVWHQQYLAVLHIMPAGLRRCRVWLFVYPHLAILHTSNRMLYNEIWCRRRYHPLVDSRFEQMGRVPFYADIWKSDLYFCIRLFLLNFGGAAEMIRSERFQLSCSISTKILYQRCSNFWKFVIG